MKKSKLLAAFAVVSLFAMGPLLAAEKAESKPGKCCAKAAAEGKTCAHPCCVEAAKAGENCTKCGGSGKIEKKEENKDAAGN
ncbi:MAG: hypothetical protein ACREIA_24970 [Opitutaceae bacterium]